MLAHLPPELYTQIYRLLPKTSLNQVSLTCQALYASTLPTLYGTITLSVKSHIRQLEAGLQDQDGFLYRVILHHTKELVIKCKHSGQHRLLFDIRTLLSYLPHLLRLTFMNFHTLPVHFIPPILSSLPNISHVTLRYCDLVMDSSRSEESVKLTSSVTHLELYWTNFSKPAIDILLPFFPALTHIRLLANHNRHFMANNHAVNILQQHCPHITELAIGLQEVKEFALVQCIAYYGLQLQGLSLRCHSPSTLLAITKYTPLVQDLTVRFSLETNWYPPPSPNTDQPTRIQSSRQQQGLDKEEEESKKGGLLCVLYHCQRLVRVQVESMYPSPLGSNTLPPIISKALATVAQKRITLRNIQAIQNNVIKSSLVVQHGGLGDSKRQVTLMNSGLMKHGDKNDDDDTLLGPRTTDSSSITPSVTANHQLQNSKGSSSMRMETVLVLDDEQLKEIRSQALPLM